VNGAMEATLNAEINFHEQEVISVFMEAFSNGIDERLVEITLAAFFALRMVSNLGADPSAQRLAIILSDAHEISSRFAQGDTDGGFQLIPYPGYQGRKRFVASVRFAQRGSRFDLTSRGLGWLAKGVGYYGPIAVLAYVRALSIKRKADPEFLNELSTALRECGQMQLAGLVTLSNQLQLGMQASSSAVHRYAR
jgi:hypothetical protein